MNIATAVATTLLNLLDLHVCGTADQSAFYLSSVPCSDPDWSVCVLGDMYPGSRMQACCTNDLKWCYVTSEGQCNGAAEFHACDRPWWRDSFACRDPNDNVYLGDPLCGAVETLCEESIVETEGDAVCCEVIDEEMDPDQCEIMAECGDGYNHVCTI